MPPAATTPPQLFGSSLSAVAVSVDRRRAVVGPGDAGQDGLPVGVRLSGEGLDDRILAEVGPARDQRDVCVGDGSDRPPGSMKVTVTVPSSTTSAGGSAARTGEGQGRGKQRCQQGSDGVSAAAHGPVGSR